MGWRQRADFQRGGFGRIARRNAEADCSPLACNLNRYYHQLYMETTLAPAAPVQVDFRAELHQLIDQIQDEAVLRAALLLLMPQVVQHEVEPELSPAWQKELDRRLALAKEQLTAGQGVPFAEVMARLQQENVA